jgi:hAT family C-terminal dimerisation region
MQERQQHKDALTYWIEHHSTYYCLVDTALDFVTATAMQAYDECVFSLCGILTWGLRNRMSKSLPGDACKAEAVTFKLKLELKRDRN